MAFGNITMAFLTHVSLETDVGFHSTTLTPLHTLAFYACVLRRQANSIRGYSQVLTKLRRGKGVQATHTKQGGKRVRIFSAKLFAVANPRDRGGTALSTMWLLEKLRALF